MQGAYGHVSRGLSCRCDVSMSGVVQHQRALLLAHPYCLLHPRAQPLLQHELPYYHFQCEGIAILWMPCTSVM